MASASSFDDLFRRAFRDARYVAVDGSRWPVIATADAQAARHRRRLRRGRHRRRGRGVLGGARVLLVESQPRLGGSTALSGGYVFAAGTAVQRAAGIEDGPQAMYEYY